MTALPIPRNSTFSNENRKGKRFRFFKWKTGDQGERIPYAPCVDGAYHRYLNADIEDLERNPPTQPIADAPDTRLASCSCCGLALSELRGPKAIRCTECQWDSIAEHIQEFQEESGTQLMSAPPDQVSLRMKSPHIRTMGQRITRLHLHASRS